MICQQKNPREWFDKLTTSNLGKSACPERAKRVEGLPLWDTFRTLNWKKTREEIAGLSFINNLELSYLK